MSRTEDLRLGSIPLQTLQADVQYGFALAIRRAQAPKLTDAGGNTVQFTSPLGGPLDTSVFPPGLPFGGTGSRPPYAFQDGLYPDSNYAGTQDTEITSQNPNGKYGSNTNLYSSGTYSATRTLAAVSCR